MNTLTTTDLTLHFSGPYGWPLAGEVRCVFDAPVASSSGLYLWSVATPEGELVYYVGETGRDFATRLTEHLRDQLGGWYVIYEPSAFARGEKNLLWGGMLGKRRERHLWEFVRRHPELAPHVVGFVRLIHFHLAPCTAETRLRQRIEAALADHLYQSDDEAIRAFQDDDIRYHRSRPDEPEELVLCTSDVPIRGLPERLRVAYRGEQAGQQPT